MGLQDNPNYLICGPAGLLIELLQERMQKASA